MNKVRNQGFSLIELMIVVAIVAILSAVAFPSYQQYRLTAIREEAKERLMTCRQAMEEYYVAHKTYIGAMASKICPKYFPEGSTSVTAYYRFTRGVEKRNRYIIQARPLGIMAADRCGWLQYNSSVDKKSALLNNTTEVFDCW